MREVKRSALIAASPARLFALINDVERYPEFLPWCQSAQVKERNAGQVVATLGVRKGLLRMHFTTRNVLEPDRSIRMELVDGPFRSLHGLWTLTPIDAPGAEPAAPAGCRVDLQLRFEFAGALTSAMLEPAFEAMATSLFDAFLARARSEPGKA
jgi:ribosome-associated toxin RatA of RatAB toxin-antitoxin module